MTEVNDNQVSEQHEAPKTPKALPVVLALFAVFVIYLLMAAAGLPQKWSNAVLEADHHEAAAQTDHAAAPAVQTADKANADKANAGKADAAQNVEKADAKAPAKTEEAHQSEHAVGAPPIWTVIPFCLLLLCIAILPLIKATEHWWESNFHRFLVAAGLGLIILLYYTFMCDFPIAMHWPVHSIVTPEQGSLAMGWTIIVNAIINDYVPFIVLLFALFTISGGIRISGDLKASPFVNTVIIAIGATLASFVGTTAAAMLLIRLLLETNKERKYKAHTVIFFIFCACNCGGCLLPIGDPPLFLGYLKGVNFLWTFQLWKEWLFVNGIVLLVYFLWDSLWFYRRETDLNKALDKVERTPLRISGWFPNLFCLMGVVAAVMFLAPGKTLGSFNPWMFLREIAQLVMVAVSLS
ncbi:MAG: sodium:proton antiporter, partial [Thermoguttaceae bacterium]|nr:sodium:proton antiporter [Thermoguttaceae bacterium]